MKKVLLLGGAGFIGFNIVKYLCKVGGYKITIADNFFRGKLDKDLQEVAIKNNIRIIEGDFTFPQSFELLDKDYDQVYMLASVVGVKYTEEIPNELIRINTSLILNTLEWIKNSTCKKLLFTSTSECYTGTIESFDYQIPTSEEVPLTINNISHPRFTYAVTKMLGESGFLNYSKVYGFECTIVRYHNVYGPRMGFKHVIPQVTQRFINGEIPFYIIGYDQTRSFNFIEDAVKGTVLAMEKPNTNGEIFHLGDMNGEISIEVLIKFIGEQLNYKGSYKLAKAPTGSVGRRCPDTSKASKILGYEAQTSWKEGITKTVNWYINYLKSGEPVFE